MLPTALKSLFMFLWKFRIHFLDAVARWYFTPERAMRWRRKSENKWIEFGNKARLTEMKADDIIYDFGRIYLKSNRIEQAEYPAH